MKAWYELIDYSRDGRVRPNVESSIEVDIYEDESSQVLDHVRTCKKDGFCGICQSL